MSLMSSSDTLEQQINRNVDTSKIQILKTQITDVLNIKTNTKQTKLF
jgi:hypothetical protein